MGAAGGSMQALYDGLSVVGSLVIMAAVIVATYYAGKWYAGRMNKTLSGKHIKVIDRVALGAGSSAAVLQVGDRYYLVGVSDKNVQLICALEGYTPDTADTNPTQATFGRLFKGLLRREAAGESKNDGTGQ